MHAGLPRFSESLQNILNYGRLKEDISFRPADRIAGTFIAEGIARIFETVFRIVMCDGFLDLRERKAREFFDENFVINDPAETNGTRFYQGKFLITTKQPGDDMNVWVRFCPNPDKIFTAKGRKRELNERAVIDAKQLSEAEAEEIINDPSKVDLVIQFRDLNSILGILQDPNADIVSLLLKNVVQMRGNLGHMFKMGAIAKNIELALSLSSTGK